MVVRRTQSVLRWSSFEWNQPCKNQTVLQLHPLCGYSKQAVKSDSHSFRVTCSKSAVSLLKSREQHHIKVTNFKSRNLFFFNNALLKLAFVSDRLAAHSKKCPSSLCCMHRLSSYRAQKVHAHIIQDLWPAQTPDIFYIKSC